MESITKNRQSIDALRAIVARAYGRDRVPTDGEDWVRELGHGWFKVVYRIRATGRTSCSRSRHRPRWTC